MRTTVRLDDEILEEAKRLALKSGTTLTAVFEEALREMFARRQAFAAKRRAVDLPTFKGRGLQRGIDPHDSAALLDAMEAREDAGA